MDSFEEHISNLELYDSKPPGNHIKRFETRLNNQFGTQRLHQIRIISVAASLILLISLGAVLLFHQQPQSNLILANEDSEYIESEQYFQHQIDQRIATIHTLDKKELYVNEIKTLDEPFQSLKDDLATTPGDPRVVDAVLNTYMLKIEALDNIVNILKKTI